MVRGDNNSLSFLTGKLNSSAEDNNLKAGTVLELPLWLGQQLSAGRQPVVSMDLPRIYKEAYREILKADPCAVDLHKLNLYFFELGFYVKHLDSRGEVSSVLLQVSTCVFLILSMQTSR